MENLINILEFDKVNSRVYFNHLGSDIEDYDVRISYNNFTLYQTKMTLANDPNVRYFVGFSNHFNEFIDTLDLTFSNEKNIENKVLHSTNQRKNYPRLENIETKFEDPAYYTYCEIFIKKIYENKLVRIWENDIVVDIGANYGFFSIYADEFKPSKIFSFEPSKSIFNLLVKNVPDSVCHQKAVGGESKIVKFTENYKTTASNKISQDENGYEIEMIGINDLFNFLGLERIDFLKIDCEGSEKQIFENIDKEILYKINKIVVEYHSQEIKKIILDKLNEFGFQIVNVTDELIFTHNPNYFKNKKKIALISTYCDTREKKDIFLDLLKKVKKLGVDTIAISALPLDPEHIETSDYLYFTKENPILKWPMRLFTFWKEYQHPDGRIITLHRGVGDYGWAALYHVKKLTQIAMDYDYDIYYHMIYDLDIDSVVERALLDFEGNVVYPRRDPHNPETLWETTLHFMSFDKDMMKKIEKEITLESYLSTNGVAEGEVLKWKNKFNISSSDHPVRDKVFYWQDFDFFNYSPIEDFKFFISKNDQIDIWVGNNPPIMEKLPPKLRLVFYDLKNISEIDLSVNNINYKLIPKPWEYIELPIDSNQVEKISISYKQKEYDLTSIYSEIMLNQVYYNKRY